MPKPDFFKEAKSIQGLTWVLDNATVRVATRAQQEFIDSPAGTQLMDDLFDAPNPQAYKAVAKILEQHMQHYVLEQSLGCEN